MTDQAHPDHVQASAEEEAAIEEALKVNPLKALTFGKLVDGMYDLRAQRQELDAKSEALKVELDAMEQEIIARLDTEDTTMTRGKVAYAILTESEVPKVDDWDLFYEYMLKEEAVHMLQRRISTPAARETILAGDAIPGVSLFTKRQISLRKNP